MTTPRTHTIAPNAIRDHYDILAPYYHRFWGDHIHHGFGENGESLPEAQLNLVEKLAACARIPRGARVLDVGCGVGGSALWLGRELGCSVLGITVSGVQVEIARRAAAAAGFPIRCTSR